MIHAVAWLAWVGAVLVILSTTRNPWYLGAVLAWIGLVTAAVRPYAAENAPIPISPLRFGLFVVAISALFNALTVHFGRTVLFALPDWLPLFGGPVTLEATVYGALNGLVLAGLFAAFSVINRALPIRAMIRLVPRAFYPVAVVTSIAITFVPVTLRQFRQIREAQAVRGHRLRGLRDWLPLLLPLLVGGLERALQLAEAMTARGFASSGQAAHDARSRLVLIAGLVLLLAGWLLRLVWGWAALGAGLLLLGIGLIAGMLWLIGRRVPRTVYRPAPWTRRDWVVGSGALMAALVFLVPWPGLERASIYFYPYPSLFPPGIEPVFAIATLGLLGPAIVLFRVDAGSTKHRTGVTDSHGAGNVKREM